MTSQSHPEWVKENSLTAPADRDHENKWRPEQGQPVLTNEQTADAMTELYNTDFIKKFPRLDRTYADPPIQMQNYGLISFTPAKGAKPDKDGVFGFAKLRGNYQSELESQQRAEFIVRNVDSYHSIYTPYVGRPFPITFSSKYSAETDEIDIRKKVATEVSQNVKDKKAEERKTVAEIKAREEALLEDSKNEEEDPYENYITLRVKKAQLTWTYLEHQKKMEEVKDVLLKTRKEVDENDTANPDFKDKYFEKYKKARADAGIKDTSGELADNFIKYMVEDVLIPGIDGVDVVTPVSQGVSSSSE